jgi:hypothetical protein
MTVLTYFGFSSYGFLASIFDYGLLRNWLTHSSSHTSSHAEAAWLELGEVTSTSASTKVATKELVFIEVHHAEASKWISLLVGLNVLLVIIKAHVSHAHVWEATAEEIIVIVVKAGKWVLASKEVFENLLSTMHVEVSKVSLLELEISTTSTTTTRGLASIDDIVSTVLIVVRPLLLVAQNTVRKRHFFKYFFCCFFVVRIFVWMVFKW